MKKKHQYAQSAPISGFNSPDTSEYSSREPSPALQGKQQQHHMHRYHILPYVIGAIGGPLVYKFGRRVLNTSYAQSLIARHFNKGNRLTDSSTSYENPKTDQQTTFADCPKPQHTALPKAQPIGVDDL